jgi:hypothetical protein
MRKQSGIKRCDFCSKTQDEVKGLVAGPNNHICNECIAVCAEILEDSGVYYDHISTNGWKPKKIEKSNEIFKTYYSLSLVPDKEWIAQFYKNWNQRMKEFPKPEVVFDGKAIVIVTQQFDGTAYHRILSDCLKKTNEKKKVKAKTR